MADFDEARQATESMFAEPAEETPADVQGEEVPAEQVTEHPAEDALAEAQNENPQGDPTAAVDEAANIAEAAANAAAAERQKNEQNQAQLQQLTAENEQLRQANEELQDTITQQSQQQKEQIIENAMPELDMNALAFASPQEVERIKAEYAAKMRDYLMGDIRKEFEPAIEYAQEGIRERERANALNELRQIPELKDIDNLLPQIDKIIAGNKYFENMPIDEQLINAYAMARGVNAMNTPPAPKPEPPTAEQLMEYYNSNPEFQKMLEQQRLQEIKQSQQVPAMSASSGAVNAALNIQEKPKTWEDASQRTRDMFRADEDE